MTKLLIVLGPTATGKTKVAIELAKALNGEVVSADSMQIYQGMEIGTAKPSLAERQGIPHHLMDFVPPDRKYSVAQFQQDAANCIREVAARGKRPIVAGGTGLYIDALIYPLDFTGAGYAPQVREKWEAYAKAQGPQALHACLAQADPQTAARFHVNDVRRVVRALEVYEVTGLPMSAQASLQRPSAVSVPHVLVGLTMQREQLYARIERRVDAMFAQGLVEEVEGLLASGITREDQSMQAIGYKEVAAYLAGAYTLAEAAAAVKQNSRRYAKRQLTWFRRNPQIRWFAMEEKNFDCVYGEILAYCLGNHGD